MSFASTLGSTLAALGWRRAWAIDFEFIPHRGSLPDPVTCMVAHCVITGERRSLWLYNKPAPCPFDMADDGLFIAHSASVEVSCFIVLGWPLPTRVLDTMIETARLRNGKVVRQPGDKGSVHTPSLLESLAYFDSPGRSAREKGASIDLVLRGGPYTQQEINNTPQRTPNATGGPKFGGVGVSGCGVSRYRGVHTHTHAHVARTRAVYPYIIMWGPLPPLTP